MSTPLNPKHDVLVCGHKSPPAPARRYWCTMPPGHTGHHHAEVEGDVVVASWTPTTAIVYFTPMGLN